MRGQRFLLVNAAIKYEIAVCTFSYDRAETEDIFVPSTKKHNILCVASLNRCLKCNPSPCMNFGHHTNRQSNEHLPIHLLLNHLSKDLDIYWSLFCPEYGNSNESKLRFYMFCFFLGRGGNDNWCSWRYGLDRYAYYKFYFKLLFSYGSVC